MRAAVLQAPGVVHLGEFDDPTPEPGDVVVEMDYASICGSDVHIVYDGLHDPALLGRPGYPGHEGVGVVVESRTERFPVGTAVLTTPPGPAGGCFAELQRVNQAHLLALPEGGDPRRLLLAQQLGTTIFALKKFLTPERLAAVRTAVVIGAGSAGLFFLQQLRRSGVGTIVVSDLNPERLAHAARLGASHTVLAPGESQLDVVAEVTAGAGAEFVVEAAGYDLCRAEAVEAVLPRGTIGLFGYPERPGLSPFPVHRAFRKAVTMEWLSGTQAEPGLASFATALELIHTGAIEVDYCLDAFYPLDKVAEALTVAREQGRGAPKVGLTIRGDGR